MSDGLDEIINGLVNDGLNFSFQEEIDSAAGREDCRKALSPQKPDNEAYMFGYHGQACQNYLDEVEEAQKHK